MHISSKTIEAEQSLLPQLHHTMLTLVRREGPDLTARQLTVFLSVYLDDGPHTVRGLAQELDVCKPAVTRALDRLGEFDLARRKVDPTDRRSVIVLPTPAGRVFLAELRAAMGTTAAGDARAAASAAEIASWRWAGAGRPANDAHLRDGPSAPRGWFRGGPALRLRTEEVPPAGDAAGGRPASGPAGPVRRRADA